MKNNQTLHEMELAFFGTITASISHELNNVLSIINEYSGLLADLVAADKEGIPIEKEKINKIAQNIIDQIKRERDIIKLLNRFAHRVDSPVVQFNLNDLANDIVRLARRFASIKKVTLEITLPQESISLTNNPFGVQHAIFSCLNLVLDFSNTNDIIITELEQEDLQSIVNIRSRLVEQNEQSEKKMENLSLILENVGGKIKTKLINEKSQITKLYLPLSIPDRTRNTMEEK
jgi:hypothetical protein